MASITEISKIAGVCPATVSNVINRKSGVSAGTAVRVHNAMRELEYVPVPPSRRCGPKRGPRNKTDRNRNIGIWFSSQDYGDINYPLYSKMICCLEKELRQLDLCAVVMNTFHGMPDDISKVGYLDGAVVLGKSFSNQAYQLIQDSYLKAVFVLGYVEDCFGFSCDHIIPSNPYIGILAANYLLNRGHSNLAVVNPSRLRHTAIDVREDCFVNHVTAKGGCVRRFHIDFNDRVNGLIPDVETEPGLEVLTKSYLKLDQKPTGIFIPNDLHLMLAHKAFRRAGIDIGRDMEFIGCNNEQETLAGLDLRPATIDIGVEKICYTAVERLLKSIEQNVPEEGSIISVRPEIVEGETNFFDEKSANGSGFHAFI